MLDDLLFFMILVGIGLAALYLHGVLRSRRTSRM